MSAGGTAGGRPTNAAAPDWMVEALLIAAAAVTPAGGAAGVVCHVGGGDILMDEDSCFECC